ncbi:universal stress protein [uncultured Desulfosarcina sp.]|uniref:universal stress protein n=1 Tax=uncultured Desulfosarcina sp. TaxID=218289 RepID=UPI0029C8DA4E|nr:universal stress protein [uncultured Desulfosarcina sp.]
MNRLKNNHIVIAVDGSENSRRAVAYVGELLGGLKGFMVTLLHVIHAPEEDFFSSPLERERWIKSGRKKVERWITEYRDMLVAVGVDAGDVSIRAIERDGPSLAQLILAEMQFLEAGTIVLGRQGLSPKEEFLFGSVSKQIVSHARNCTVWVVQ